MRLARKALVFLVLAGLFPFLVHFALRDSLGASALAGLAHAGAYLPVLWYFGRSLRPGREPGAADHARRAPHPRLRAARHGELHAPPDRRVVRVLRGANPSFGAAARGRAARRLVDVRQPARPAAARVDVRGPVYLPGAVLPA